MCYMVYEQLLRLEVIKERVCLTEAACWIARFSISKCRASTVCMGPKLTLTKSEKFSGTYTLSSVVAGYQERQYSGKSIHCARNIVITRDWCVLTGINRGRPLKESVMYSSLCLRRAWSGRYPEFGGRPLLGGGH